MKLYLYAAILLGLVGSHLWMYAKGESAEKEKGIKAALEFRNKENKLIADLQAAQAKKEIIFRDKIKVVEHVVSQCADIDIDPAILNSVRDTGGSAFESGVNR